MPHSAQNFAPGASSAWQLVHFAFFLRCTAFGAELGAFAKLGLAFDARNARHLHLLAAIGTEFGGRGIVLAAFRARNGGRIRSAMLLTALLRPASERIGDLAADGKSGTESGT